MTTRATITLLAILSIAIPTHADEYEPHEYNGIYQPEKHRDGPYDWQWSDRQLKHDKAKPTYYFPLFDTNNDIYISEEEFSRADVDRSALKTFSDYDSNGDGRIDIIEFQSLVP